MTVRFLPPSDAGRAPGSNRLWGARGWWRLKIPPLFLLVVVVPIAIAAIYLFLVATPRYVSEASFIIREQSQHSELSGSLGGILQEVGIGSSQEQSSAVENYLASRDAIKDLERRLPLRAMLARPGADPLMRFPRLTERDTNEELYKAYPRFVEVGHDSLTNVSTLKVTLFRARDSQAVASALLDGGEALVNRLNARAEGDAVQDAEREVDGAQAKVSADQAALTEFRNREGLIDPSKTGTAELELLTKLDEELQALQAERSGLAATAPQDPQLPGLDNRIKGYQRQIIAQNAKMAGEAGSLAPEIAQYEQLNDRKELDDKILATAIASVETARQAAANKRLYLERVVNPEVADMATEPRAFAYLAVVAVSAFIAYGILILVIAGLREHHQA